MLNSINNIKSYKYMNSNNNLKNSLQKSIIAETKSIDKKLSNIDLRFSNAESLLSQTLPKNVDNHKIKIVKDSFTIPEEEYSLISKCQEKLLNYKKVFNKSEIIRLGLIALNNLKDEEILKLSEGLLRIKTGKPKRL